MIEKKLKFNAKLHDGTCVYEVLSGILTMCRVSTYETEHIYGYECLFLIFLFYNSAFSHTSCCQKSEKCPNCPETPGPGREWVTVQMCLHQTEFSDKSKKLKNNILNCANKQKY